MTDRLFVPAPLSALLAEMPPATATPFDRLDWLDRTFDDLRRQFRGPHGLEAMRMAQVIARIRNATHDELTSTTASAA